MVYGIILATLAYLIARAITEAILRRAVELARKPGETVECRNATVLMDKRGELSWIDNDRLPWLIKRDIKPP